MKKTLTVFSFLFCLLMFCFPMVVNASTLTAPVTVGPLFQGAIGRYQVATIQGNLTLDGNSVTNGLVTIQADVSNNIMFIRTVNSGSSPQTSTADIQSVYSSDANGNPVSGKTAGTLVYFHVTVNNNQATPIDTLISVSVFDSNNCPIGYSSAQTSIPQGSSPFTLSMPIPTWASSGEATVYATLCSSLPSAGGIPYCIEESGVFTITGKQGPVPPAITSGNTGVYTLSFRIPPKASTTIPYTIYVSSSYNGLSAFGNTPFSVNQPSDFNGDVVVNYLDIAVFVDAYINYYSNQPYDSRADFNHDGKVNYQDIGSLVTAYMVYYAYN
jgi:hypothetical protein